MEAKRMTLKEAAHILRNSQIKSEHFSQEELEEAHMLAIGVLVALGLTEGGNA